MDISGHRGSEADPSMSDIGPRGVSRRHSDLGPSIRLGIGDLSAGNGAIPKRFNSWYFCIIETSGVWLRWMDGLLR